MHVSMAHALLYFVIYFAYFMLKKWLVIGNVFIQPIVTQKNKIPNFRRYLSLHFELVDPDLKTMISIAVKTLKLFIKTHLKSH